MTKSKLYRALLLSACAGLAGCSSDSARYADFYGSLPTPTRAGSIDYTTTASVGANGAQGGSASRTLVPPVAVGSQGRGFPPAAATNPTSYPSAPPVPPDPLRTNVVSTQPLNPVFSATPADAVDVDPVPMPEQTSAGATTIRAASPAARAAAPSVNVQPIAPRPKSIADRVRAALPKRQPTGAQQDASNERTVVPQNVPALNRVVSATKQGGATGWSNRTAGTTVKVREGETLYNLSKRYGIPVASIMQANGIADARSVNAGRELRIPTYSYSAKAPVSAPDANPDVRAARGALGMKGEPLGRRVPAPTMRGNTPDPVQVASVSATVMGPVAPTRSERPSGVNQDTSSVRVGVGDTLYRIAARHGTSVTALRTANQLTSDSIRVGQVLAIPNGQSASAATPVQSAVVAKPTVTPAQAVQPKQVASLTPTVSTPAQVMEPAAKVEVARPEALPRTNPQPIKVPEQAVSAASVSDGQLRWPVRGRVVQDYGGASKGIAIATPTGSPIRAAEGGKVIYAGSGLKELGKTVLVQHENGLVTVYGYADELRVAKGQTVSRGDVLGASGMTGSASTPSVHFQVRKGSTPVDPTPFLN